MVKILENLKDRFSKTSVERKIDQLTKHNEQLSKRIEKSQKTLERLEERMNNEIARQQEALEEAKQLNKSLETTLKGVNEELQTANEITIPGLVASSRVLIDRWDAQSAVEVMRQTAAQSSVASGDES